MVRGAGEGAGANARDEVFSTLDKDHNDTLTLEESLEGIPTLLNVEAGLWSLALAEVVTSGGREGSIVLEVRAS